MQPEVAHYTANQDVLALTQKLSSILPIVPFKIRLAFSKYIGPGLQKSISELHGEVEPKAKALPHFKLGAV